MYFKTIMKSIKKLTPMEFVKIWLSIGLVAIVLDTLVVYLHPCMSLGFLEVGTQISWSNILIVYTVRILLGAISIFIWNIPHILVPMVC